jgi:hypothetical protein
MVIPRHGGPEVFELDSGHGTGKVIVRVAEG